MSTFDPRYDDALLGAGSAAYASVLDAMSWSEAACRATGARLSAAAPAAPNPQVAVTTPHALTADLADAATVLESLIDSGLPAGERSALGLLLGRSGASL